MQYLKFTHVDAVTGVSVFDAPAANGPVYPAVAGLVFVWARESQYPTLTPELFGTCPDGVNVEDLPGVLAVLSEADFEAAREAEKRALVPAAVTMRQARLALLGAGLLDDVGPAIAAIPDATTRRAAEIEWEFSNELQRGNPFVEQLGGALGLTSDQVDSLFIQAKSL